MADDERAQCAARRRDSPVALEEGGGGHVKFWWQHSRRRWRLAATVLSATCLLAAVLTCVGMDAAWGYRAERDVLLSAAQQRTALREAKSLRRIHSSYDRAKGRLERLSAEYTNLSVKLQAAESRAGSLRTELESKMREIRGEFHHHTSATLEGESNTRGLTMQLAAAPPRRESGTSRLANQVRELKQEVRHLDLKEAKQAIELHQMQKAPEALGDDDDDDDADIARFPRRPMLAFKAERTLSQQKLASLAQLQSVKVQLEAENRRICELCASSAILRANRQHTCSMCSQYAPGEIVGDTDLTGPLEAQQPRISSLAAQAMNMFVSTWKPSQLMQQAAVTNRRLSGSAMQVRQQMKKAIESGAGVASNNFLAPAFFSSVPGQQLVQIDDGDHMGTTSMQGPLVTAYIVESGERYVVGTCTPSADELKFSSWESICTMCKGTLGVDVEALGNTVLCQHE